MTVTELLAAILKGYAGADPEALKTYTPVFYSRFRAREGAALAAAAEEVFATFRPKYGQPFPIPLDFEEHMPSTRLKLPSEGTPSIGGALKDRAARASTLYQAWFAEQGHKIKAARHQSVYGACVLEAMDQCRKATERTQRVILSAEQIALCEARALSSERVHRRAPARTNEAWQAQIDEIKTEWAA